jgi:hypothetical protein
VSVSTMMTTRPFFFPYLFFFFFPPSPLPLVIFNWCVGHVSRWLDFFLIKNYYLKNPFLYAPLVPSFPGLTMDCRLYQGPPPNGTF